MKRLWLGLILAVILLVAGLWISSLINRSTDTIAGALDAAAEAALAGNFQTAAVLAENAQSQWEDSWHRIASVADHAPMDEIDSLFAQLAVYARADNNDDFAAYCLRLSKLILAVGEAHTFNWWNLL